MAQELHSVCGCWGLGKQHLCHNVQTFCDLFLTAQGDSCTVPFPGQAMSVLPWARFSSSLCLVYLSQQQHTQSTQNENKVSGKQKEEAGALYSLDSEYASTHRAPQSTAFHLQVLLISGCRAFHILNYLTAKISGNTSVSPVAANLLHYLSKRQLCQLRPLVFCMFCVKCSLHRDSPKKWIILSCAYCLPALFFIEEEEMRTALRLQYILFS